MKNPFQYLQDRREAEQAKRERDKEAKQEALERLNRARMGAATQYDEMVMGVLEPLREIAYPRDAMRKCECHTPASWTREYEPAWSIGRLEPIDDGPYYSRDIWVSPVEVSLVFNKRNQPTQFDVRVGCQSRGCRLTESELIATLKKLHPE